MKVIKIFTTILVFGTMASAQEFKASNCQANLPDGTSVFLKTDHGRIGLGEGVMITTARISEYRGYYIISEVYSPSFSERAFGLGFRGGFSHGSFQIIYDSIYEGPLRMQKFIGDKILEGSLVCE